MKEISENSEHLSESLPEPDTFKKLLKRFRMGALVALLIVVLGAIGVGVVSYQAGMVVADQQTLKTKDVVKVLKRAGLELKVSKAPTLDPKDSILGDEEPQVYDISDGLSQLYIYEFESSLERRNVLEEISRREYSSSQDLSSRDPFTKAQKLSRAYGAKNMVMVMVYNITLENMESENKILAPITLTVGKTIFYELNQGRKFVLQGEGEHWEAKFVVSIYEEQWTDESGYKRTQQNSNELPLVRYKGNPEEIRDITYRFEWPGGASSLSSEEGFRQGNFDDERTSAYGGSALLWGSFGFSTGRTLEEDDTCDFSVEWNGGEEERLTMKVRPVSELTSNHVTLYNSKGTRISS